MGDGRGGAGFPPWLFVRLFRSSPILASFLLRAQLGEGHRPPSVLQHASVKGAVPMPKSKQLSFLTLNEPKNEHGGSLALNKRRARRPLKIKQSHHLTMKSHHAIGSRSLFRHKKMILGILKKNSYRFHVKVYKFAIQGNHLHLLVKACRISSELWLVTSLKES